MTTATNTAASQWTEIGHYYEPIAYYGGPPNYWSPSQVQAQVLTPLDSSALIALARRPHAPTIVVVDNDAAGVARETVARLQQELKTELTYDIEPDKCIAAARNRAVMRFLRHRLAVFGLAVIILLILASVVP